MHNTMHAEKRGQQRGFTLLSNLVIDAFGFDLYDGKSAHYQCLSDGNVRRQLTNEAKSLHRKLSRLIKQLESKDGIAQIVKEDGTIITSMNTTSRRKREWRW
jgi:hypothetical protein